MRKAFSIVVTLVVFLVSGAAALAQGLPEGTTFTLKRSIVVPAHRTGITMLEASRNISPNRLLSKDIQDQCFVQVAEPSPLPVTIEPASFVYSGTDGISASQTRCLDPDPSCTGSETDLKKKLLCSSQACERFDVVRLYFAKPAQFAIACRTGISIIQLQDSLRGLFDIEKESSGNF